MSLKIDHAVIVITGARATGKTSLASTFLPPSQIDKVYYHDSEHSANSIRAQLKQNKLDFGRYVDLADRFKDIDGDDLLKRISSGKMPWVDASGRNALIGYYEYVLDDLDKNLTKGKYKVYVLDTLEKFEAGMAAYVEANKKATGVTSLAYGKMWTDAVFPLYENFLSALFGRGIEVVILTSHLRSVWEGTRQIVGKVEPAGKRILYRLSSLMLWTVHSRENADGAPAALVLKERLGNVGVSGKSDDEWDLSRRLPERIPHATWSDIRRYLKAGVDLSNPSQGETMSEAEREMISELLSDAQMRLMILQAESEARESSIVQPASGTFSLPVVASTDNGHVDTEAQGRARALLGEGKTKRQAADELGITLPELIRLTK